MVTTLGRRIGLLAALGALVALGNGCASKPSYYEVRLVQPNQFNRSFVQSADKPQLVQGNYMITDGKGASVPLPKDVVQSIEKRPLADIQKHGSRADRLSKVYELTLVPDNPYNMKLVRSADKPQLNKDNNYVITDDQGAVYFLAKQYVAKIDTRPIKEVRKDVPSRFGTAPGTGGTQKKSGEANFRDTFGYR